MKGFYQKISGFLEQTLKENYQITLEPPLWELPAKQEFGDFSSMAALKLAAKLKKDPLEIAGELKSSLEELLAADVERIEILRPGFINLFIAQKTLIDSLGILLKDRDKFFRQRIKERVLLEFVSANPTGPLSIAHGRQAVVGDVIANILDFFGSKVEREYYINDQGRQVKLLIDSVRERAKEIKGRDFSLPAGGYAGEYVKDIAKEFLSKGKKDLDKFVLSHILSLIRKDLAKLGVKFDRWVSQKQFIKKGRVNAAVSALKDKGLIYQKDGALWFASAKFGDDKDRVIRKADGELTYFASDIAYHREKIRRKFGRLINLWGPDHHGYIERVSAAIAALGYKKEILKVIIIQLVKIKTKMRMSRRKGTAVLLSDLIEEAGRDTARFYYLTRKNSSHLEFDLDQAKAASFDNPLYYIQYACARTESIFRKAKLSRAPLRYNKMLSAKEETSLLRQLLQFSYFLEKAYYALEPAFIVEYLKSLAANFHKFYEGKKVLGEAKEIMSARLNLLAAARIVFHCGLNLLGIKPVKKM